MERIGVTLAGHPVPDKYCAEGCQKIVDIINDAKLTDNDLVITAIGNGVSALMTLPWPEVPLEDVTEATRLMQIGYGVNTGDLNQIRVSVDQLKGGRISG
jgi:hydroxypyruvate reductase